MVSVRQHLLQAVDHRKTPSRGFHAAAGFWGRTLALVVCGVVLGWCASASGEEPSSPTTGDTASSPDDGRLLFNFRYQPWQDVLDWFADQAGLSLVLEAPPPGTFNYRDSRRYTPAEALDVLNGVLLTKGYTLVRRGRMLMLVNLEDGIPPNLVSDVPLEELDQRGEYELIRVLFPVRNMSPEQAAAEVEPLLGPQGSVVVLPQARQIQVTETGGRLRMIRRVINAVESPDRGGGGVREFELKYLSLDAAMPVLRQMLGIPDESFSTPDGTLHLTKDSTGRKVLARGTPEQVARLEDLLRLIDVSDAALGVAGVPQLEVYPITTADPDGVLKVLETLLEGEPELRLAIDAKSGYLVAFARPAQHATIRATIDQMQQDARQIAVIPLTTVDPQIAVLAINKLFGGTDKEPDPTAPRVDADPTTRSLLVRGSSDQVEQIRGLLRQLGETEEGQTAQRGNVRLLPLTGSSARSAISQLEQIWPTIRPNRIRVVAPAQTIPTYRPSESDEPLPSDASPDSPRGQRTSAPQDARPTVPEEDPSAAFPAESGRRDSLLQLVSDETSQPLPEHAGAPILVAPGPGGVVIVSEDLEALDDLEELLTAVAGRNSASGRQYAVFYLKYAKAATVSEVLAAIFGGKSSSGNLVGDLAGAALGDLGGGLMGDLLLGGGGASGGFSSASIDIVPDIRLNALVVRAKAEDLDTVEQLLRVLDQRVGPEEVEADARPRLIPVYNTSAAEVAAVVQQVYQDRLAGPGPAVLSPQEMIRMIRGNGNDIDQQVQKMSLGIDERSNSLVVRAPDPLFEEIKALVAELDQGEVAIPETTRVVSLRYTNSAAVQQALSSMLGNAAGVSGDGSAQSRNDDDGRRDAERRARRDFRRQMEMMRNMQRLQGQFGDSGGGGGGGRQDRGGQRGNRGGPSGGGRGGPPGGRGGG